MRGKNLSMLAELIVELMEETTPPGHTAFSVAIATECAPAVERCEGAKQSPFYGAWVRKETAAEGRLRYAIIAQAIVKSASNVLCLDEHDQKIDGCEPYKPVIKSNTRWGVMYLGLAGASVATYESGFREDVMVGRGWAKKISVDGGMGRGPGMEGCLMQPHPQSAWKYAPDVPPELYKRAAKGDRQAREAVILTLVGSDEESLVRCFTTGMRMLVTARSYCAWASPKTDQRFAMFSMYGTGNSCISGNNGKTVLRQRLYEGLVGKARARRQTAKQKPVGDS